VPRQTFQQNRLFLWPPFFLFISRDVAASAVKEKRKREKKKLRASLLLALYNVFIVYFGVIFEVKRMFRHAIPNGKLSEKDKKIRSQITFFLNTAPLMSFWRLFRDHKFLLLRLVRKGG
jgi:hypothetical protein